MDQFLSHELTLFDLFGRRLHFTPRELLYLIRLRMFIGYHLMTVAILVLVNLHGFTAAIGPFLAAVVWSLCSLTFVIIYVGLIFLLVPLQRLTGKVAMWLPVFSVVTVALDTIVTNGHVAFYTGQMPSFRELLVELPFNLVLTLIFEAAFFGFAMPVLQARLMAAPRANPMLTLAGQSFRTSDVMLLESQEHYLHIYTRSCGNHIVRARISDALAQLDRVDGMQTHRSFWVARDAVTAMVREDGSDRLHLQTGRLIPVARARSKEVRAWLNEGAKVPQSA